MLTGGFSSFYGITNKSFFMDTIRKITTKFTLSKIHVVEFYNFL